MDDSDIIFVLTQPRIECLSNTVKPWIGGYVFWTSFYNPKKAFCKTVVVLYHDTDVPVLLKSNHDKMNCTRV